MKLLQKLREIMEKLDLSEREIAFYIAVLKNPHSTVYELAKKCSFPKDRAYQLAEALQTKCLIVFKQKATRREIVPASLKSFSQKIYEKSCKLWKYSETLKHIDPLLPLVDESRKTCSIDILSLSEFPEHWEDLSYWDWDYVFGYGNFEMLVQEEKDALSADCYFRDRRTRRGKFANPLLTPGPYTNELIRNDAKELRKTQVLDIPELRNDLIIIFPTIDRISSWSRNEKGVISGTFIHDTDLTRFHYRMHQYFKQVAECSS